MEDFNFEFKLRPRDGKLNEESRRNTTIVISLFLSGILCIIILPFILKFLCSLLHLYFVDNKVLLFLIENPEISWIIGIMMVLTSIYLAYFHPIRVYELEKMTDDDIREEKKQWLESLRVQAEQFAQRNSAKIAFSSEIKDKTATVSIFFTFIQLKKSENFELNCNNNQTYIFEYF